MTVNEVAESWAVSPKTVRRLVAAGQLPEVRVGRALRVRRTDAAAYLEAHLRPLTAQDTFQVVHPDPDSSGSEDHHGDPGGVDGVAGGTP